MKVILSFLTLIFLLLGCQPQKIEKEDLRLWYNQPANNWNEALPIGNGHSGAMVFGGTDKEQLSLNENTLYSGEPSVVFKDIKITPEQLNKVVNLLKDKKYLEANEIVAKHWLGRLHQYYQPFGDLYIENNKKGEICGYKRELNISESVVTTEFKQGEANIKREVFASNPDNLIIVHLTSDVKDGLDISLNFTSPHPTAQQSVADGHLILKGKAPGYVERRTFEQIEGWGDEYKHPELYDKNGKRKFDKRVLYGEDIDNKGMLFEARVKPILPHKGEIDFTPKGIHIYKTDEVYFLIALATSYNGFDKSPSREGVDPSAKTFELLENTKSNYSTLKNRHIEDYRNLFDRVSLALVSDKEQRSLPTDERIMRFAEKPDPDLAALLFQYGRYLMISGSRPGGQPLNLQGMWNIEIVPPWNSGYTQNINAQMNYWPAEVTNLSECHEPLFRLIKELSVTGTETAKKMYNRRGWVAHHNTSLWREPVPNDNVPTASFWPMAQGWYGSHLWEHFLYTNDTTFLRNEAYPIIKGAAEFFADWLVNDGKGYLVTPAGISPENAFYDPNGKSAALSMGPTMDMAIIKETFIRTIQASEVLMLDSELRNELQVKYNQLLPYRIGEKGQLQEWMYDFKEVDSKHRHLSHLYGFYPGDQITPDKTAELFKAVEQTLLLRGDEATGWSMGWKINLWARMLDGNHAYKIIANFFNPVDFGKGRKGGGLYRNMFDAHPPFQIDGNFGYTAGIAEMLMQSHAGFIHLLPALPDVWAEGKIDGLKTRGNFELQSMEWSEGVLRKAEIISHSGNSCHLRTSIPFEIKSGNNFLLSSQPIQVNGKTYYEAHFDTLKEEIYLLFAKP